MFPQVLPCYFEKLRFIKLVREFMKKVELFTGVHILESLVNKIRKCEYLCPNTECIDGLFYFTQLKQQFLIAGKIPLRGVRPVPERFLPFIVHDCNITTDIFTALDIKFWMLCQQGINRFKVLLHLCPVFRNDLVAYLQSTLFAHLCLILFQARII